MRTGMLVCMIGLTLASACGVRAQTVAFTTEPVARKDGEATRISFAVSTQSDVEVAIVDMRDKVVRHLAAGQLGKNAPGPFKKDALAQELIWDGKDDFGQAIAGDARPARALRVRVRLGVQARLDKHVGWDGNTLGDPIVGLTVGKDGELFVMLSEFYWGRSEVRVFSRDGKYLRTILPYPAGTPKERAAAVGQLEISGERLPIVFNGHGHNLSPLTSGMKHQTMAWSPKGYLLLCSAVGSMAEHGPPRHLLALHPEGGSPEGLGFVGPRLLAPRGFMDGAGEYGSAYFDHLAVSPDGELIYVSLSGVSDSFKPRHGVFRVKWSDKEIGQPFVGQIAAGPDDEHMNDPQGLAVDKDGRLYVCDRGNDRVLLFTAEGRLIGKLPVGYPEQIAVNRQTGEFYVLSRPQPDKWEDKSKMSQAEYDAYNARLAERAKRPPSPVTLCKFAAWGKDAPKELARRELPLTLMALDGEAVPARLWGATGKGLFPVAEKGDGFELGTPVNNTRGLDYPLFVAADPVRPRVLVREQMADFKTIPIQAINLDSGEKKPLMSAGEAAFDRDGNIYAAGGWGSNAILRYDPDGKPLPFPGSESNRLDTGPWTAYGPNTGLRGFCVAPNGDIYHVRAINHWGAGEKGIHSRVDVFGPDGKRKKPAIIDGLADGDCGIGVDAVGNIYIGSNVKPAEAPFPPEFAGKVPAKGWLWWGKEEREIPWRYTYHNPYLFHWGSVFKFAPTGGAFYGLGVATKPGDPKAKDFSALVFPANAPADAATYTTGYLDREVKVVGAIWRHGGMGPVPTAMASAKWGDPACGCLNSRLAVDEYGRVYMPNVFRFCVGMLDTAGNQVTRIGRYGNADDAGPETSFAWPAFVSVAGDRVVVSDPVNRRVTVVKLAWQATAACDLP